jgi:hypothetical protein
MGIKLEWMEAKAIRPTVVRHGEWAADNQLNDLPGIGIELVVDDGTVIHGTKEELLDFAARLVKTVALADDTPLNAWTVSGYWDPAGFRIVTSVVAGQVDVTGGDSISEGGPFAVYVNAEDSAAAESMVHGTDDSVDFD